MYSTYRLSFLCFANFIYWNFATLARHNASFTWGKYVLVLMFKPKKIKFANFNRLLPQNNFSTWFDDPGMCALVLILAKILI